MQFPRGGAMKLHYYPKPDSLYIELKSSPGTEAREIAAGLVVDLDANGEVVGFDIDHASRKLDLSKVETIALPPAAPRSNASGRYPQPVIAGLDPAIHPFAKTSCEEDG